MKRALPRRALGHGKLERIERIPGQPTIRFDYRDADGKRHRRQLSNDPEVAVRVAQDLIRDRDLALHGHVPDEKNPVLAELAEAYLADLRLRVSAKHALNKAGRLSRALALVDAVHVNDLTPLKAVKLQTDLVARGRGNVTSNMHLHAIGGMLTWAVGMRLILANPIKAVRPLPITERYLKHRRRALSEAEIGRFLEAAATDDRVSAFQASRSVPQLPFWRAMVCTGMRFGEARTLTWSDVDFDRGVLHLRPENTKSSKHRVIPLHAELLADLRSLRAHHECLRGRDLAGGDLVFLSPRAQQLAYASNNSNRILRRLLGRAGIPRKDSSGQKIDLHALRVTFGTRLGRQNVTLVVAQKLMGHADPKLTAKTYTRIETADTRAAIDALPATEPGDQGAATKLRLA